MTRLLHFGDLHLGAGPDYGRAPSDRLQDQARAWARVLELAETLIVDAVVGGGDTFHGPAQLITPEVYAAFQRPLRSRRPDLPVVVVTGNGKHDAAMRDVKAPEVIGDVCEIYTQPTLRKVGDVTLALLPWCSVARLVAEEDGGDRRVIHHEAAQKLLTIARGLRAAADGPMVLVPHWSISGAATPTGAMTDSFSEVVLPLEELTVLGFDAIVASHIHKHQVLSETPWIGYTSSTCLVDFGEADVPHGAVLLDIDADGVRAEFVPIDGRRFVTIDVDLVTDEAFALARTGEFDETDCIAAAVAERFPLDGAVVKLRYRATEKQALRIDLQAIRDLLADAGVHKLYKTEPDIVREARVRVEGISEELAPLDAVGLWCETQKLDDSQRQSLAELTERLLEAVAA